jgi:hypothetical protein
MRRIGRQPVLDRKPWCVRLKYGIERTDEPVNVMLYKSVRNESEEIIQTVTKVGIQTYLENDSVENKSSLVYPIIGSIIVHTN